MSNNITAPTPLPLTAKVIYQALLGIFPDHALSILAAIKKILVIKEPMDGFGTMGITASGILLIDQEFWDKEITSQNRLRTILMHELLHNIGGDVYNINSHKDDAEAELRNLADVLAMDARINAFICNSRPDIDPVEFLVSYYNDEVNKQNPVQKILRPGVTFSSGPEATYLKPQHDIIYKSMEFCGHQEFSDQIYEYLKKTPNANGNKKKIKIKLLGSHGTGADGKEITEEDLKNAESIEIDLSSLSKEDLDKLKKEAKEAKQKQQNSGNPEPANAQEKIDQIVIDALNQSATGAGQSDKLTTAFLNQALHVTERFDINRFKQLAFNNIFHNVRTQAKVKLGTWTAKPLIPQRPAKSDIILMSAGIHPVLYKQYKYTTRIDKNLLPIYLDVSGSTTPFLPEIIRLIANISDQLDYVWGFSNKIAKHTIQDLNDGKIITTGGTDFDCVIDHAESQEFEHIVVITDGDASTRHNFPLKTIKSVVTILFGYSNQKNFFTEHFQNTHSIEEVKV
jgi:predicted metal-dependent peptidase